MQIHVSRDKIEILDPAVLTALSVASDLEIGAVAEILAADGLGSPVGADQHLWLDIAELGRRAAVGQGPQWPEEFAAMVGYAASKGWTDEARTVVRAHLETTG